MNTREETRRIEMREEDMRGKEMKLQDTGEKLGQNETKINEMRGKRGKENETT